MMGGSVHHLGRDVSRKKTLSCKSTHETKESQGHGSLDHERIVVRGMWDGKKAEKQFKAMDCNRETNSCGAALCSFDAFANQLEAGIFFKIQIIAIPDVQVADSGKVALDRGVLN